MIWEEGVSIKGNTVVLKLPFRGSDDQNINRSLDSVTSRKKSLKHAKVYWGGGTTGDRKTLFDLSLAVSDLIVSELTRIRRIILLSRE
jgi:hypothetical protein